MCGINSKSIKHCVFIIYLLLQGCGNPTATQAPYRYADYIHKKDCWFSTEPDWPDIECAVLEVPEDYDKTGGRKVKLPLLIIKAEHPNQATYPLVVTGGGGPGNGLRISESDAYTFGTAAWIPWYSSTIDAGRDLILIDNRGVGSSVPRLNCHEVEDASLASLAKVLSQHEVVSRTQEAFAACRARFVRQGVDLSQYHVVNAARDLEQLRSGLGLEKLNIYGASYGTRVALEFERLYPDSVRSLILDGVYPQSVNAIESQSKLAFEAIQKVIAKCNADNYCANLFGHNLEARLADYLKTLEQSPIKILVTHPVDYEPVEVVVTPDVFFDSVYSAIYDVSAISGLPKALYATLKGNTDYLTQLVRDYYISDITTYSLDEGAYASYTCFDEFPFSDFVSARGSLMRYPLQHYSNSFALDGFEAMCTVWNVPPAKTGFKAPYKINTPVLVFSGELDPVTPASMAESVVKNARIAWEITWPNLSHGVMFSSQCADWTAKEFLSAPEADPFIYECTAFTPRYVFVID